MARIPKYKRKTRHKDSLCWTCSRAYALPDSEGGCAFHRRDKDGDIVGFPFTDADITQAYRTDGKDKPKKWYSVYAVTQCPNYCKEVRKCNEF